MLKKGGRRPCRTGSTACARCSSKIFFDSLSKSYKQGYCDWIGPAKQEETRKVRAEKALIMLKKGVKLLIHLDAVPSFRCACRG
jgi:hypothetical protein